MTRTVLTRTVLIRCAAVLLVATLGLVIADNARPWKRLQVEFFDLERGQLESSLAATRASAAEAVADLEARIESEQQQLADRRDEIDELEDDLRGFRARSRVAEWRRERLGSELEKARRREAAGNEAAVAEVTALVEELRQARMEVESLGELVADREGKLAAVRSDLDDARDLLARARAPIEALEGRLAELPGKPILPFVSLFAPGVAVREVSLPEPPRGGVGDGGTRRQARRAPGEPSRVDRCATCHLGAARDDAGSDGWPPPHGRHPRLDLFLGADSPHPYEGFGCTACHGGDGRATDFSRAGHVPVTAEQEAAWAEDWGWRRDRRRVAMLPLDLTEAACGRCHGSQVFFPEAEDLDAGRRLIVAMGCTACHPSDHPALRALPRIGPSLVGIAGKTTRAWAHRWLEAPRASRPTTRMPHFFDLEAGSSAGERQRRSAEIRAIVDYLWQTSRPADHEALPAGEPEAGRVLFHTVGCQGCHLLGLEAAVSSIERRHGPHLAGTGSKVAAGWLHAWLRNPRSYREDSPMPSLRLDERQAADLTAYLMTRRDPAWEGLELPEIDVETRDRLVLSHLARDHTLEHSQAQLERMSERDKNAYLGERTIAEYGCHGCHQIAGFEGALAVGPSLGDAGRKLREAISGRARPAGTPGRWSPSSHRPAYAPSDGEARAVTVALLGLTGAGVWPSDERTAALAEGRRVLDGYNCRGCHLIEGRGGVTGAGEAAPPDLAHAGARLKSSWLHAYLADPGRSRVRPWLAARMPTFGLSEAESNALVRYFALRAGTAVFAAEPPEPRPAADVAVGKVVFTMLQCGDCHRAEGVLPQLAPPYRQAAERLRSDWVIGWILDPERWIPGTPMPSSFLPGEGEELDSEFLIGSIHTPIFSVERERLMRLLGSKEALHEYLSDPERVAAALRDYLWSL